jgi:hypothetical protein
VFSTEVDFEGHLQRAHPGKFTDQQLRFQLVHQKCPTPIPFVQCPFCDAGELCLTDVPNLYEMSGDEYVHLGHARRLENHIARHLLEFSAMAFLTPAASINSDVSAAAGDGKLDRRDSLSSLSEAEFNADLAALSQETIPDLDTDVSWVQLQNQMSYRVLFRSFPVPEKDPVLITFSANHRETLYKEGTFTMSALINLTESLDRDVEGEGNLYPEMALEMDPLSNAAVDEST